MGSKPPYHRCDGCGKRRARTELYAYRASGVRHGPWLAERLCEPCVAWYRDCGIWSVRVLEPFEQPFRGVVMTTAPLL